MTEKQLVKQYFDMKIYYELPPEAAEIEEAIQKLFTVCPAELLPAIEPLMNLLIKRNKDYFIELMEKYKYKLMWELRSLELEIDNEKGILVINEKGGITSREFTSDLEDKIAKALDKSPG